MSFDIKNMLVRGFIKVLGGLWAKQIDTEYISADECGGTAFNGIKSNISALQTTTTQLNSQLVNKANALHTHTKSQISDFSHTHDDRYFTESEINSKLALYTLKKSTHSGNSGFNNYITQGQYMMADGSGTGSGNPYNGTCWGVLFVHVSAGDTYNGKSNWVFQEFWSTDSKIYRRQKVNADAWTAWKIY